MKILFFLLCSCWLAAGSTLDNQVIKNLFANSSGLSTGQIGKINFENLNFDVGVIGSPEIITGMKGGSVSLKWGEDKNSFLRIKIFAQKRYDNYVDDLLIPMDIFQGVQSDDAKAALNDDKLKETWRPGKLVNLGSYCVGQHLPVIGAGNVNAGFFFNDEYGFCMQISTSAESGVSLESLEEFGVGLFKEIAIVLENEGVRPNPLDKTELFVFSKSFSNIRQTTRSAGNDENEIRVAKPNQNSESDQSSSAASELGFWASGFGAIIVLLAMLLGWWQRRKKAS